MSTGIILFLFAIAVALILAVCAVVVWLERNFPSEKYDERQKIARGNAYRFGHWVGEAWWVFLLWYFLMGSGKGNFTAEPYLLITVGFVLQALSFHIYCLLTHSALPLGQKSLSAAISYFFLGVMYTGQFFRWKMPGVPVSFSGDGHYGMFYLILALFFFSLSALHLISHLRKDGE